MRLFFGLILIYGVLIMTSLSALANEKHKTAILAGGCFWCIEHDFEKLDGIIDAVSGYAGGDRPNPTYENYNKVTGDFQTPHIEVIQVTYDPAQLSYRDILEYHYRHIDPTDGDGQFCDRGPGYRPAVFVKDDEEREIAETINRETAEILGTEVKVEILPNATFYPAEDYHQNYADKNPIRYKFYRWNCGRDQRVAEIWGKPEPKPMTLNQ
jgi:peptide-methionine (S)-S-oxide reductase